MTHRPYKAYNINMEQGEQKMNNTTKKNKKKNIPPFLKNNRILPVIENEEKKVGELKHMLNEAAEKRVDMVEDKG